MQHLFIRRVDYAGFDFVNVSSVKPCKWIWPQIDPDNHIAEPAVERSMNLERNLKLRQLSNN